MIGTRNTKRILETIQAGLKVLSSQTEKLMQAVENLEKEETKGKGERVKPRPAKGAREKSPSKQGAKTATTRRKQAGVRRSEKTATDKVVEIIEKAGRPLDVAALADMTGFDPKKIRSIVSRAAKQGRINRAGRGLYVSG